jgi:hypothetical protein
MQEKSAILSEKREIEQKTFFPAEKFSCYLFVLIFFAPFAMFVLSRIFQSLKI